MNPESEAQPIALTDVEESARNYRRTFNPKTIGELAQSLRKVGVLQPVIVRPHPKGKPPYELVIGARRLRAAHDAELDTIPAFVRELDDVEVLEIQVIENSQREDPDPYEEAEGFTSLHRDHGRSVEEIAAKVGKSKGFVYERMKLAALDPKARDLLAKHDLSPSHGLLVARIPDASLHLDAAKQIATPPGYRRGPLSFRDAKDLVHEKYMVRLKGAPFDQADPELVPEAGPCSTCPKRSGNQRELFADVKSSDVCTDPACFKAKSDAAWAVRSDAARAAGQRVLDGKEAQNAAYLEYDGRIFGGDGWVALNERCRDDAKGRSYGRLIPKSKRPATTLCRVEGGRVVELLPAAAAHQALKAAGHNFSARSRGVSPGRSRYERERRRESAIRADLQERLFPAIDKVAGSAAEKKLWRALLLGALHNCWHEAARQVMHRRAIVKPPKAKKPWSWAREEETAIAAWAETQPTSVVRGVVLELMAVRGTDSTDNYLTAMCKTLGVNLGGLRRAAAAAVKAKESDRKKKARKKRTAKKPGKKATRTKSTGTARKSSTRKPSKPQRKKARSKFKVRRKAAARKAKRS